MPEKELQPTPPDLRQIVANHVLFNEPPVGPELDRQLRPLTINDGIPLRAMLAGLTDNPDFRAAHKDQSVIERFRALGEKAMSAELKRDDGKDNTLHSNTASLQSVGLRVRSAGARRAAGRLDYPSRQ